MNIIKYNQFEITEFHYRKKISLNDEYSIVPIYYTANHTPLIIQTPILYIPFETSKYNTLDISFTNTEDNNDINDFKKTIDAIINKVKRKYKRKFSNPLIDDDYFPCRLRVNLGKSISHFNSEKQRLTNDYKFTSKSYAKFILEIRELWVKKNRFGINITLLQAKHYKYDEPVLKDYSFIDSDDEDEVDLSKYEKMKRSGVPEGAIIQRMTLDGVEPGLLFKKQCAPPPPPMPPNLMGLPQIPMNPRAALLGAISGGNFKLKKAKIDDRPKPKMNIPNNGFKISIDEIKAVMGKLKRSSSVSYV